jgi:hypothetical protein
MVVRWPSGQVDKIGRESADQLLIIQEGKGVIERRPPKR